MLTALYLQLLTRLSSGTVRVVGERLYAARCGVSLSESKNQHINENIKLLARLLVEQTVLTIK